MREVEKVRDVTVDWRLFSLELLHEGKEDPLADLHVKGTPALRTLALVRREHGPEALGRVYDALGHRVHDEGDELNPGVVRHALKDAGLGASLVDRALEDPSTMQEVRAEHETAVAQSGAFGVPTIVLPSGRGMFGPVIAVAPQGQDAGELWDHVRFLVDHDGFFELKRERDRGPGEGPPANGVPGADRESRG